MQVSPRILWRDADVSALVPYGWTDDVALRIATIATVIHHPARVIRVDRGSVLVATPDGVASCRTTPGEMPATVGDWVVVRQEPGLGLVLDGIVDRHTAITRRDPSGVGGQVLAANVDTVLITVAIDRPLRASRLERSLVLVWDGGASPAVVLTKRDLVSEAEVSAALEATRDIVSGVEVLAVSAATGAGCSALFRYAGAGATVALIGASGAGKSTLANRLVGDEVLDTGHTRHVDGKGRHTTTARELIPVAAGGVLIDTPGLRAVGLGGADGGVAQVFSDIDELGDACRFRDCRHASEPGCAIRDAIEAGELSARRYRSYQKILREQSHVTRRQADRNRRNNARDNKRYRRFGSVRRSGDTGRPARCRAARVGSPRILRYRAAMEQGNQLTALTAGMPIVYAGNRVTYVDDALASAFRPGDRLVVVQTTGDLLHIPADVHDIATSAVDAAVLAFEQIGAVSDAQISAFYEAFALRLADEACFGPIASANAADVENAKARGRSVTRLILSDKMRADMVAGLRAWRDADSGRGSVVETVRHDGWRVHQVRSGLGVVGFVFEGRPNVFADATGVLRSGNTVVFRIGSDALGTAEAIVEHALDPALAEAGLPPGAASLVASPSRAAGYALFSDSRVALAVARGSGGAVAQLGAVARQAGIAVSLHGTGGGWIVASANADPDAFGAAVYHSLDRKVCNTLNTCCIVESAVDTLLPVFLDAVDRAGRRRDTTSKLHIAEGDEARLPAEWFERVVIARAEGQVEEPRTSVIAKDALGVEWEWEDSPEVTLKIVPDVATAVGLFNAQSPRFVASLISEDLSEHEAFFNLVDAPFVGNGFTRWVDGQYALDKPELGLSNWQTGRLFGRGGILSGDSVFTVRSRVTQDDPEIGR